MRYRLPGLYHTAVIYGEEKRLVVHNRVMYSILRALISQGMIRIVLLSREDYISPQHPT